MLFITEVELRYEEDILYIMKVMREYMHRAALPTLQSTKYITAISEMCRNVFQYAEGGFVQLVLLNRGNTQLLKTNIIDEGVGIENLDEILNEHYVSTTGMGVGIKGAKKLVDHFEINTSKEGTFVSLGVFLDTTKQKITSTQIKKWQEEVEHEKAFSPLQELKQQNQELAQAYETIRVKEDSIKEVNEKLQSYVSALKRKNEELEEFAHIVAHDLKSPLSTITMAADLVKSIYSEDLTEDVADMIDKIEISSAKMKYLINDMLEYATASVKEEQKSDFSLLELAKEVIELIHIPENVSVELGNLPKVTYDRLALKQVIQNLLTNAIKYSDKPKTIIKIDTQTKTNTIILSVADNGIGIAPEHQDKIFTLFATLGIKKADSDSTGIGLAIIKKIAERNGGDVWLDSELGKGTTFYFKIAS